MKKRIMLSLFSILIILSLTTVTYAATQTLVGKKVQKVVSVDVDGKKVKDAIVVDGTTYAPVRSFSEAAGYSLSIDKEVVKLQSIDTSKEDAIVKDIQDKSKIGTLQYNISTWKATIEGHKETVKQAEKSIADVKVYNEKAGNDAPKLDSSGAEGKLKKAQETIAELESKIKDAEAEIKLLEK